MLEKIHILQKNQRMDSAKMWVYVTAESHRFDSRFTMTDKTEVGANVVLSRNQRLDDDAAVQKEAFSPNSNGILEIFSLFQRVSAHCAARMLTIFEQYSCHDSLGRHPYWTHSR